MDIFAQYAFPLILAFLTPVIDHHVRRWLGNDDTDTEP